MGGFLQLKEMVHEYEARVTWGSFKRGSVVSGVLVTFRDDDTPAPKLGSLVTLTAGLEAGK